MRCPVCKKNISEASLKCPYCKARTGLLCSRCNTINPVGNLKCKNCGQELLKICSKCGSVNYPGTLKCRKCGSPFNNPAKSNKMNKNKSEAVNLEYNPELVNLTEAVKILVDGVLSKTKRVFSVSGPKGIGKTTVLNSVIKHFENENYQWCIGKCTQLTQVNPGGVIQDMLLNLFRLPNICINNDEFKRNASEYFSKEFKFLDAAEIYDFINFLYNFKTGNYEDIVINKKRTFGVLNKIFEAFALTERFIFIIDNFDFIDGFSVEFLTDFVRKKSNWKNIKFIVLYENYTPISRYFALDGKSEDAYCDINLAPMTIKELEEHVVATDTVKQYVSEREKEVIFKKSLGNLAYVEQAMSYAFDCQINDKTFILPDDFSSLIKTRLDELKQSNKEAYKMICGASILGYRLNINFLASIFEYKSKDFEEILSYLVQSNFIRKYNDEYYEFNNLLLWENVLKNITKNSEFDDINVKIGRALGNYTLNSNAIMAMIAHNLRENRMAFDIWTKTARLAAYVGDINLYVIAQRQCLAILNEFNENETVDIRFSISEKLGKILSEYDPEEALEFLPDAIANAKESKNIIKEIDLLSYLAYCCKKTGNYFGNVECVDRVLKELDDNQTLEKALIISSKLESLLDIGNCGEVINLVDNDVIPVLQSNILKPRLSKMVPLGIIFDTWLKSHLVLAWALALQGNKRVFEVLKTLYGLIDKHKINDKSFIYRVKLAQAYANAMRGDFLVSEGILNELNDKYSDECIDDNTLSRRNLVYIIIRFMKKEYDGLRAFLFEAVTFANNIGDNFTKNILKLLLGKMFKDNQQAQHALEIYNEQVTFFAKEKMALGALLSWYLIADATIVTENSRSAIDVASQALEIAKNPRINNIYFIVNLNMVLASANVNICDFETAKIHLEAALSVAKKYELFDLLSRCYFLYGKYYQDIGAIESPNQKQYLSVSAQMYEKAMETIVSKTKNSALKEEVSLQKEVLNKYCSEKGFSL